MDIVVSELEWSPCELLSIQSYIYIELQALLIVVLELRHNANYFSIVISSCGASPILFLKLNVVQRQVQGVYRFFLSILPIHPSITLSFIVVVLGY